MPTSHSLTPVFVKINSSPKADEDLRAASCPHTPQPFYGGLRKALGPLAPGSLSGRPCEFRPQQIAVSVRSALIAAWSRPPPVLYGLGAGWLSGAARDTGPVQSHVKGMLIVSLPPLSQPLLLHCIRAWGLFRFVCGFSLELVFRPGWLGSQGRPIAGTGASHLFIPVKRSSGGQGH